LNMETVAGVFQSRAQAEEAVRQIHSKGIANDRIAVLTPGMSEERIERVVPIEDDEQPGMGSAMGGAVGGAMGVAGGASLGAAAASLLIPGVGPVIAGGLLGAAILGAGGTATGIAAGKALERELETGLPHDELYLYEDALRKGRSVVVAFTDNEAATYAARSAMSGAGAESIDQARENWWIGLRDAEAAEYETRGQNFETDEPNYRRGFEAALKHHRKPEVENAKLSAAESNEAFRCGYERGKAYQRSCLEKQRT
jgi:hypothetical protein